MPKNRLAIAALVLLGLAVATLEQTFIHTDDGCVLETHCSACLLQLGTDGLVTLAFSLPPVEAAAEGVATPASPSHEDAAPRARAARGPPCA
jgi:hypothetical protein